MMKFPSPLSLELLRIIVVDASRARGLEDQVDCIDKHVHQAAQVDVCSLYLLDSQQQQLRLISTVGLNPEIDGILHLPIDKGLVGTAASRQLSLMLDQVSHHPDYQYFPESGDKDLSHGVSGSGEGARDSGHPLGERLLLNWRLCEVRSNPRRATS